MMDYHREWLREMRESPRTLRVKYDYPDCHVVLLDGTEMWGLLHDELVGTKDEYEWYAARASPSGELMERVRFRSEQGALGHIHTWVCEQD